MNKEGFSIAEMMVVMLILSIVLAAATPIITKRVIARANETTEQAPSSTPGSIMSFAGTNIPDGWLLCDGKSYSTTGIYSDLFAAIGYNYGGSSTNFNVPNLQGRVPIGVGTVTDSADIPNISTYTLASKGGEIKHLLTVNEMPSHSHTGYTDSQGTHTHQQTVNGYDWDQGRHFEATFVYTSGTDANPNATHNSSAYTLASGAHAHNVYTYAIGNGISHNVMQPYIAINYIIKY